jgi:hypothetical protein
MEAGVQSYSAFLRGKRVVYLGRQGDLHPEWFPRRRTRRRGEGRQSPVARYFAPSPPAVDLQSYAPDGLAAGSGGSCHPGNPAQGGDASRRFRKSQQVLHVALSHRRHRSRTNKRAERRRILPTWLHWTDEEMNRGSCAGFPRGAKLIGQSGKWQTPAQRRLPAEFAFHAFRSRSRWWPKRRGAAGHVSAAREHSGRHTQEHAKFKMSREAISSFEHGRLSRRARVQRVSQNALPASAQRGFPSAYATSRVRART